MSFAKKWEQFVENLEEYKVRKTSMLDIVTKALLFIVLLVTIPIMFSADRSIRLTDMKVGSIASKKVVAPFQFYILKTEDELEKERRAAVNEVPYYFTYNDSITDAQIERLDQIFSYLLRNHPKNANLDSTDITREEYLSAKRDELKLLFDFNISQANLNVIFDILNARDRVNHLRNIIDTAKNFINNGILSISLSSIIRPKIAVMRNDVEYNLPGDARADIETVQKNIENKLLEKFNVNQTIILNYFFNQIVEANLIYNRRLTERSVQNAVENISLYEDLVYENQRIVDANELITEEVYQKLYSLEHARMERNKREGTLKYNIIFLAKMMLIASIILIFGLYLYSFRKKIYTNNKMLFMISIILMLVLIIAAIISGPLNWHAYVIPTTIASMLLVILIDSGIAFVGTVVLALILGGIQGGGYDLALVTIISGMVAIFSVHKIRRRNQVFKAIIYIAAAYLWVIVSLAALRMEPISESLRLFAFNLLPNAVLSPLITFMVLGAFEKLFDITTDVTLLELSDLNHPVLKRLSMEAPGTFHHSMVVGNLAESAAKAIDANSLLARVGSYYHDIGKMEKPEYFVENQMNAANRHNQLAPRMSALILASHVKAGIDLAKKYGIPRLIRNFIPEHHGTGIMQYFYNKAIEKKGADTDVNAADFRYPGPKPQSRETGIVMLADSVEAATRTINNPTPNKVRAFVEDLVDKKFKDGELDECDLTLRDLKRIVDAFMPILFGVFQHRIEYPDLDKKKNVQKAKQKTEKVTQNGNSDIQS